jgi:OmpA-OmpF porin, OOP family
MFYNFKRITPLVFICFSLSIFSQSKQKKDLDFNTWSIGAGFSSTILHGDFVSFGNMSGTIYPNLGGYLSVGKMFNPIIGTEFKLNFTQLEGEPLTKPSSGNIMSTIFNANGFNNESLMTSGLAFGFDANLVVNLDNVWRRNSQKWSFSSLVGFGFHNYSTKLIIKDYDPTRGLEGVSNEGVIGKTNNSKNDNDEFKNNAGSIYLTAGLSSKYRINDRFDIESRLLINLNNEDNLDAAIMIKQGYESFFTFSIGAVYKLGSKKKHANWYNESARSSGGTRYVSSQSSKPASKATLASNNTFVREQGVDTDNDGLIDSKDNCPKVFGNVNNNGCPLDGDIDKDGILDSKDLCPTVAGTLENEGCPNKKSLENVEDELKSIAAEIHFGRSEGYVLQTTNELVLDRIGQLLTENPSISVKFEVHTSNKPNLKYNLGLSRLRANAIVLYLSRECNVAADRIEAVGLGGKFPKFSQGEKAMNAKNNRVEVSVK